MQLQYVSRTAGVLMLGPFLANVYIGMYDKNLSTYSLPHYYLNWAIVAVDLVAALILIMRPRNFAWITMCGVVWPVVYFALLAIDIETLLCLGTGVNCWPNTTAAFQYLILGDAKQGWGIWPYTMELSIALLVVIIALSTISVKKQRVILRISKMPEKNSPVPK